MLVQSNITQSSLRKEIKRPAMSFCQEYSFFYAPQFTSFCQVESELVVPAITFVSYETVRSNL